MFVSSSLERLHVNTGSWMPPLVIGFPFAKLLRNFCGTKRKIFLSLRISFARKKQQFAHSFAKVFSRKIALFRKLRNKNSAKPRKSSQKKICAKIAQILRKRSSHFVETLSMCEAVDINHSLCVTIVNPETKFKHIFACFCFYQVKILIGNERMCKNIDVNVNIFVIFP